MRVVGENVCSKRDEGEKKSDISEKISDVTNSKHIMPLFLGIKSALRDVFSAINKEVASITAGGPRSSLGTATWLFNIPCLEPKVQVFIIPNVLLISKPSKILTSVFV